MKDFFDMHTADDFVGRTCKECYAEYAKWCIENNADLVTTYLFGRTLHERYNVVSTQRYINDVNTRLYMKAKEV